MCELHDRAPLHSAEQVPPCILPACHGLLRCATAAFGPPCWGLLPRGFRTQDPPCLVPAPPLPTPFARPPARPQTRRIVEAAFGQPLESLFLSFEREALASGSIAQVTSYCREWAAYLLPSKPWTQEGLLPTVVPGCDPLLPRWCLAGHC